MYGGECLTVAEVEMSSSTDEGLHHWLRVAERYSSQRQRSFYNDIVQIHRLLSCNLNVFSRDPRITGMISRGVAKVSARRPGLTGTRSAHRIARAPARNIHLLSV